MITDSFGTTHVALVIILLLGVHLIPHCHSTRSPSRRCASFILIILSIVFVLPLQLHSSYQLSVSSPASRSCMLFTFLLCLLRRNRVGCRCLLGLLYTPSLLLCSSCCACVFKSIVLTQLCSPCLISLLPNRLTVRDSPCSDQFMT